MKDFKNRLLEYYGISNEDFLLLTKSNSIEDLPQCNNYKNIMECARYLHGAVNSNKKILIYGDYDCDGVMATSIAYLTLKSDVYTPGFYIPFRETDGYGLTKENIERFKALNYEILLLVDNGITLNEEVEYANSLGMDVVIFDHHTIEGDVPKAKFILHPILSGFSSYNMCAGSVSFFFSIAYLGIVDEYLLTLAMISTISDLMELRDYNRLIVKLGLDSLNRNRYKNIMALITNDKPKITEYDIGMSVCPKVNAIGRVITDNNLFNIIRYFVVLDDNNFTSKTKLWIENTNIYRKQLVKDLSKSEDVDEKLSSIVLIENNLKEGLTGLVAARYMEDYDKPTVILVQSSKTDCYLKGSIRSKNGFDVNIILDDVKDLLVSYGGHANAGGLTIDKKNFTEFKERFEKAAKKHHFLTEESKKIEINLDEINKENYDTIESLSPYGQGFHRPLFIVKGIKSSFLTISRDGKHIIKNISPNSSIIYFNYDKSIFNYEFVSLIGYYDINYFKGYCSIQFHVTSFLKFNKE